ncbi:zinc finger BED domain-containing protein RICESLEEPER 2-like [Raphanus sativus]|uniref:Zinc finger BED domain-containing protein RICESLEEPER 2-like n=1 Tax=Raphanus sativus TaxID=3726 RepID=A0A9W3CH67_RAPSA|nr:zinc finger BED domain-containing protein RICESLEEPER 2-like [Raphanus sativus]
MVSSSSNIARSVEETTDVEMQFEEEFQGNSKAANATYGGSITPEPRTVVTRTLNLQKHLTICKEYQSWLASQANDQTEINNEGNLKSARVAEPVFREASNELIVLAELPLSFIESVAWKTFCNKVNLYKPHSRRTATRDIVEMYVKKKTALKNMLRTTKQRVSLTTDIWVSQVTGASYMVIAGHFIDASRQLKKLILSFKYVIDHKGQTISNVLLECLAEWGIERVFCIIVDNATANTSAIRRFHSQLERCSAHIINLIAKEGLAEVGENMLAIRNAIQYVRSSTPRLNAFDLRVTSGRMSRGSLPMDIKTRWNSTFLMLSRALQFRAAFDRMEAEDRLYNEYFLEMDNGVRSTLVVSASSKVNSYKCYGEIVTIERNLTALANSFDPELKVKASEMLHKFLKYWEGIKGVNKMLILATIFDPRKKMQFAKLCFEKLYEKDSLESKEMVQSVGDILKCMFTEYNTRFRGSTGQSSQSNQAPSSQPSQESQDQGTYRMALVVEDFGYERMDCMYNELIAEKGEDTRDELEVYLKEPVENPNLILGVDFDVLSWWKLHHIKFHVLSEMARDLLAMQVSSVASESAFSTSGRILEPYRSCLTHYMTEVLMCTEQWMHADIKLSEQVRTNEQMLSEVELLDRLEKEFQAQRVED